MVYNHKSDRLVQDFVFNDLSYLLDDILDEFVILKRYESMAIYAPSFVAVDILTELFETDMFELHPESDDLRICKDKEILITIGYDGVVFIEPARYLDGELVSNEYFDITYFYDGISKKDLNSLEANGESILVFGFEDEEYEEEVSIESDDNMHGFSVHKSNENSNVSYSFYSTDLELVEKMAELLRKEYE